MKDINVTIVNWKMRDDIDRCLNSLFKDAQNSELGIIVHIIDNSENSDGVKEMLKEKYPQVVYKNSKKNLGFAKAQNLGAHMTEAKYYLALNPDCEFKDGSKTLKKCINFFEQNEKVGIVGPKLLNQDGSIQESCMRFLKFLDPIYRRLGIDKKSKSIKERVDYYLMRDFDHNQTVKVDCMIGAFLMIKKEVFDKLNGFDERFFMYFEDCDLCRRVWLNKYEVWYLHDIVVDHLHKRDSAQGSQLLAIFRNPVARIHIKSWLKYFWKWKFKKAHFGY